jgi:hypothetical protein
VKLVAQLGTETAETQAENFFNIILLLDLNKSFCYFFLHLGRNRRRKEDFTTLVLRIRLRDLVNFYHRDPGSGSGKIFSCFQLQQIFW